MTLRRRLTRLVVPPRRALVAAVVMLMPLVAGAAVVAYIGGPAVTLAFLIGVVAGVPAATCATSSVVRLGSGTLFVAGAVGGALTAAHPVVCAVLVMVLASAQAPLTERAAGVGMFAPVIAAVFSSVAVPASPLTIGVGVAAGFAFVQATSLLLRVPRHPAPVTRSLAWRHAAVFAVLAGPAVLVTRSLELGHGYWLVLTLAAVLQPASVTCRMAARDRLTGTVAGVVLAIGLVLVLPPSIVLVAAMCAVLTAGWGISHDLERQTLFATPVVVLLGSSGGLESGVGLGLERLALTAVAAALAVGAAAYLDRVERVQPETA